MRPGRVLAGAALALAILVAEPSSSPADEEWGGLPDGEGRDAVYSLCGACHALDMVTQQHMTRARWDDTLTWMVETQGMPELPEDLRATVLDYLATHFGSGGADGCRETPWGLKC